MAGNLIFNVEGLREVQKTLKKLEATEKSRELKTGLASIAKTVALDARKRVPLGKARKGRPAPGRARASIGWSSDLRGAYVLGGKKQVSYYGWLDFGSREPVEGRPRSVGPWKGSGAGPFRGRFVYAAIDDNKDTIIRETNEVLRKLIA